VALVEEDALTALVEQFRSLPEINRKAFALREAMRRAAKAGNVLASECFDEDAVKMLTNLRDAFVFRATFPEWTDADEKPSRP